MDEAKGSEDLLKGWDLHVPPAERVNVLLILAIWLWHWILRFLAYHKIDITNVVQTKKPDELKAPLTHSQMTKSSRVFAIGITKLIAPLVIISILFQPTNIETNESVHSILVFLPLVQILLVTGLIWKNCIIIRYCAKRLLFIEPNPRGLRNVYILLSDTLTSFGKPLIDFSLYLTAIFLPQDLIWAHLDLLISLFPLFIRVFQCLREFFLTKDRSLILNAIKYCSSIPIITYVWYSRVQPDGYNYMKHGWFLLLNSSYTFIWDIKADWKFKSIVHIRDNTKKNDVMFPRIYYYMGVFINFMVKFWWIWTIDGSKHQVFFANEVQYFEIVRRSIWIVFKLESEFATISKIIDDK